MSAGSPTIVANMALDAIGSDVQLGDISEGSRTANVCLRAYGRCRSDLLRAAPWNFARTQKPLTLLADASGNTPNVASAVPGTSFQYSYAYPADCARIRYIPYNPFQTPPTPATNTTPANGDAPLTSAQTNPTALWQPIRPSLYLITNDPNYNTPADQGGLSTPGQSPVGNTTILSNVQYASCVYTFDAIYPQLWDNLFTSAMVAYLASEVAMAIWSSQKNPKIGMEMRNGQIAIAKNKVVEARIASGNETTVSTQHIPDWMRVRSSGGYNGIGNTGWGTGAGGCYGTWGGAWGGSMSLSDGSAY